MAKIEHKTAFLISGVLTHTFTFDKPSEFLYEIPKFISDYPDYDNPCELIVIEERDCKPRYKQHSFPFDSAMELVEFCRGIQFQLYYEGIMEMPTVDWDLLGIEAEDDLQKSNTIQRNKGMLNLTMKGLVAEESDDLSCGCILSRNPLILTKLVQAEPDTVGLEFGFGVVTLFDDGTWCLVE